MSLTPNEIERTDTFKRQYRELRDDVMKKLERKLDYLGADVFHPSVHPEKIKKSQKCWKFKVDDNYECVFELIGAKVRLMMVVDHNTFDKTF